MFESSFFRKKNLNRIMILCKRTVLSDLQITIYHMYLSYDMIILMDTGSRVIVPHHLAVVSPTKTAAIGVARLDAEGQEAIECFVFHL